MKRVVGALFVLSAGFCGKRALAQSANSTPPTAQFPSAEPGPAGAPKTPAPAVAPQSAAQPPAAPPLAPAPPPPPGAAAPATAPPPYPYPPPPGYYASPQLVPAPPPPPPSDSNEVFSITISPLHLILPIVQLTGEVRATPHFGISVIGGYGSVSINSANINGTADTVNAYELGGRLIGYPLKNFKSLQLGAQVLYLHLSTGGPIANSNVSGTGAGVAFGPFAGYKLITSGGFTFFAQLGFQYLHAQAEAHDDFGNSNSDSLNRFAALLNLDIGWSF